MAGVHAATASRALNPETRKLVNVETARRVPRAADALGYAPNPIARSLKTSKSQTVGVVIPDLTNPLFPPIVRGIEDILGPAGYSALIVNTDNDADRERAQVASLLSRHVDGLIVATAFVEHPLLQELHRRKTQMVLVNRRTDNLNVSSVIARRRRRYRARRPAPCRSRPSTHPSPGRAADHLHRCRTVARVPWVDPDQPAR